jgi:hypothetical protein
MKRAGRGPGRWRGLPLALVADFEGEGVVEEVKVCACDVENPEVTDTEEDAGRLELERGRDVDKVPTVAVAVPDGVGRFFIDWGMEIGEVAAGSGEANDPDILLSLAKRGSTSASLLE